MKMEAEVNDYSARVDTEDKFVQELKVSNFIPNIAAKLYTQLV